MTGPTDRWLAAAGDIMPALEGPAGVAERLLLLIHYGVDWSNSWVARYRATYWDVVPPRSWRASLTRRPGRGLRCSRS